VFKNLVSIYFNLAVIRPNSIHITGGITPTSSLRTIPRLADNPNYFSRINTSV